MVPIQYCVAESIIHIYWHYIFVKRLTYVDISRLDDHETEESKKFLTHCAIG